MKVLIAEDDEHTRNGLAAILEAEGYETIAARDGQVNGGGGVDKFRIKIWDQATSVILYDNRLGSSDYGFGP